MAWHLCTQENTFSMHWRDMVLPLPEKKVCGVKLASLMSRHASFMDRPANRVGGRKDTADENGVRSSTCVGQCSFRLNSTVEINNIHIHIFIQLAHWPSYVCAKATWKPRVFAWQGWCQWLVSAQFHPCPCYIACYSYAKFTVYMMTMCPLETQFSLAEASLDSRPNPTEIRGSR